jgi:hypothetical protein
VKFVSSLNLKGNHQISICQGQHRNCIKDVVYVTERDETSRRFDASRTVDGYAGAHAGAFRVFLKFLLGNGSVSTVQRYLYKNLHANTDLSAALYLG